MPRGEETQEVPQEGREETKEVQEGNPEAQRDAEVVAQPEAVVERERPPVESEAIEKEVIEAVEATRDEVSATPITLPDPPGDEVSATPITLPDPPKDQGDEVSATPITLPDPPGDEVSATPITLPKEDPDGIKDPAGEVSATPINTPGGSDEIARPDPVGDGTSFELDKSPNDLKEDKGPEAEERNEAAEAAADGGRETDDGSEVAARSLEEVSATPINTPGGGNDISATPINTPGGGDAIREPVVDQVVDGTTAPAAPEPHSVSPSIPPIEKELPEGGQMEKGYEQQENLQDLADGDFSSLMPEGKLTGPDGKESKDSKFGDGLGDMPGMGSGGKIDGSSEDPSGDQFAGKGMFKPGKGPGGGVTESGGPGKNYTYTEDEVNVMELITGGASKEQIAAKERQLQEKALDEFQLVYTSPTDQPPGKQKKDSEDPPKPKKGAKKSTPDGEEGGSGIKAVTQAEFDAVVDEVDGSMISTKDPDDQSGEVPDRLTAEGAKKVKDALDKAASTKGKQKKAGAEVITDPDQEDPEGGDLGKKMDMDTGI